jgi:mobilome CxxCx(11)CxxC protein
MTEGETPEKKIKSDSSDKSITIFGYSYIFEKRIQWYLTCINYLKFSGIILPLIIVAIALSYGPNNDALFYASIVGTPLIILQLIISILSIMYKWDEELAYSFEAISDCKILYDEFLNLVKYPIQSSSELAKKFEVLNAKLSSREQQNLNHKITEKELRRGRRYSLKKHLQKCTSCKKIPTDMNSTQCEVCGNF